MIDNSGGGSSGEGGNNSYNTISKIGEVSTYLGGAGEILTPSLVSYGLLKNSGDVLKYSSQFHGNQYVNIIGNNSKLVQTFKIFGALTAGISVGTDIYGLANTEIGWGDFAANTTFNILAVAVPPLGIPLALGKAFLGNNIEWGGQGDGGLPSHAIIHPSGMSSSVNLSPQEIQNSGTRYWK